MAAIRVRQYRDDDITECLAIGMKQMEKEHPGKDYLIKWSKYGVEFFLK